MNEMPKTCCSCGQQKDGSEFSKNLRYADSKEKKCRACLREMEGKARDARREFMKDRAPRPLQACKKCLEVKKSSEFSSVSATYNLILKVCKECRKLEYTPEKREAARLRYQGDRENIRARANAHARRKRYVEKYGVSVGEVADLRSKQNDKCAICKTSPGAGGLHVDHDHATGRFRGLLCMPCNVGLGFFKDSTKNLSNAILYLESHLKKEG